MYKNFYPVLLVFLLCCKHAPAPTKQDCQRFKNGVFVLYASPKKDKIDFTITRTGSVQTEINHNTGGVSKLSVYWLNDCTYELKLLETTEDFSESLIQSMKAHPVKSEITSTAEDNYVCQTIQQGATRTAKFRLWIKK